MKFYSTKSTGDFVDLKTAVLQSLPADGGLYMPAQVPQFSSEAISKMLEGDFKEIATAIATPFLEADLNSEEVAELIAHTITFEAPLVRLDDRLSVLELWHGPSLAFKDFGARFMAGLMSKLVSGDDRKLTILVATSGDTGGAVAAGFHNVKNVEVVILYPSGKVSPLQEKQLTTLGDNITAVEVDGTFDDCQAMVKQAFLDGEINQQLWLSSANSINISRLLPQAFYYFEAFRQLPPADRSRAVFVVPSGNFGNLTAGMLAAKMGLPAAHYVAATNSNDIVPVYLKSGKFEPRPSVATISNAMDVGNPSNFQRLLHLFDEDYGKLAEALSGFAYSDVQTRAAIEAVLRKYAYTADPHGAVGMLAAMAHLKNNPDHHCIVLETAHPSKFLPVMEPLISEVEIPDRLAELSELVKVAVPMENSFEAFKDWLVKR